MLEADTTAAIGIRGAGWCDKDAPNLISRYARIMGITCRPCCGFSGMNPGGDQTRQER